MIGFIVQNKKGDYLAETYFWSLHESHEAAWVHSLESLRTLDWSEWELKPVKFFKAKYSEESGVQLLGRQLDVDGLKCLLEATDPTRASDATTDITIETRGLTNAQYNELMDDIRVYLSGLNGVSDVDIGIGYEI